MLEHGGKVGQAASRYGIAVEEWLDLSTGINPSGWPVPEIAASIWQRLPDDNDGLMQAAEYYYNSEHILPVAGSQAAIRALPQLRQHSNVAVLEPGYSEHAESWRRTGHTVTGISVKDVGDAVLHADVLVLINPNNPTGACFTSDELLLWHRQLAERGGWLIVDEAFIDSTPESSLCSYSSRVGLIVLRSLGKFFGLAGARVGFVCAQRELLEQLKNILGPWNVNGPARWIATEALNDKRWQTETRQHLGTESARLHKLLSQYGLTPDGGCTLFQWLCLAHAQTLHETLARRGILTRLFTAPYSVRFGLPGTKQDWTRLDSALAEYSSSKIHKAMP